MSNVIKLNNISSTYVEKLRSNNTFFNSEFLLSGVFYVNLYTYDIYKTLINFSLPNIDVNTVKKITLSLFLNNIRVYNNLPAKFKISALLSPFMSYTCNWNNRPENNSINSLNISINSSDVGKYINIDITSIIKNIYNSFHGLAIESSEDKYTSMLQFLSKNSANPPYITIETNSLDEDNSVEVNATPNTVPKSVDEVPAEALTNRNIENTSENNIPISVITDIQNSITELNTKYSDLKILFNTTSENLKSSANSNVSNKDFSNEISNLESKYNDLSTLINTALLNYDILRNTINKTDETIASIVNHLAEIEVRESSNSTDLIEIKNNINNILSSINTVSINKTSIENINNKIRMLEEKSNSSLQLESIKNKLEDAINNIKTLDEKFSSSISDISQLKTEYEEIKNKLNVISIDTLN